MNALEDIAIRLQVQIEGLKTNTVSSYTPVLEDLRKILESEIASRELTEMSRRQIENLIGRVKNAHRDNLDSAMAVLVDVLRDLSAYAYEFEAGAIVAGSTVAEVTNSTKIRTLWDQVKKHPLSTDGSLLEPLIERLSTSQVVATENLLRRAHSEGWTSRQMLQAFRGTRQNRYTDGIQSVLGRASKTIISTAIQHVNSVARAVVWEENEDIVKGYRWVSTLDSRTSKECRSLDGQEFTVGKGPLPPAHMNCRSTTVAVLDPMFEAMRSVLTRASANGQIPQTMNYYDWLGTQSKEFQYQVLGPTRAALFREGGLSATEFARLQLDKFFDPLTLEEMRRLKPLAFQRAGI